MIMSTFEDLPQTTRSLLLAKLDLEIVSENCVNIFDLARKRNQLVSDVWRDICRKSDQARCLMPAQLLETPYTARASVGSATTTFPEFAVAAPFANAGVAASSAHARGVDAVAAAAPVSASLAKVEGTNAAATVTRGKTAAPTRRGQHTRNRPVMLAVGVAVLLVTGIGLYLVAMPSGPTAVRPTETVRRVDHAKSDEQTRGGGTQANDPGNVPAPVGTVRRMDTISKSFSKK